MDNLTDTGRAALEAAASRQGFSLDAARAMLDALVAGRGSQAQFSHPELGGMGQWSQGGMVMIGDMFNNGLKARVDALASDLAPLAGDAGAFAAAPRGGARGGGDWWPEGLGAPSSLGAQNDMRYAVFPDSRRLAVEQGGRVTVYDTGDHVIGGASQQQGGGQTLTFSSQFGTVSLDSLPVAQGDEAGAGGGAGGAQAEQPQAQQPQSQQPQSYSQQPQSQQSYSQQSQVQQPRFQQFQSQQSQFQPQFQPRQPQFQQPQYQQPQHQQLQPEGPWADGDRGAPASAPAGDPLATIERLAELRRKDVISEEEFAAKKAELLSRL